MTGEDSTQADERTEHEALAAERSRIIKQREHRATSREDVTSDSERRVAEVLEDAEHRDLVANARDSAANRRDMQANLDAFMDDVNDAAPSEPRDLPGKIEMPPEKTGPQQPSTGRSWLGSWIK